LKSQDIFCIMAKINKWVIGKYKSLLTFLGKRGVGEI
jgi:hypothetical protein